MENELVKVAGDFLERQDFEREAQDRYAHLNYWDTRDYFYKLVDAFAEGALYAQGKSSDG